MPLDPSALMKYSQEAVKNADPVFYSPPDEDLWGVSNEYMPVKNDLNLGQSKIITFRLNTVGEGALSAGGKLAYDIPMVDTGVNMNEATVGLVIASIEWSFIEAAATQLAAGTAQMPTFDLIQAGIESLRLGIYRRMHRLVWAGQPNTGMHGLFNDPSITTYDVSGEGNLYGATTPKTPIQLYDWFKAKLQAFKSFSRLPYNRIGVYVDDSLYSALTATIDDSTGDTPMMRLKNEDRGHFCNDIKSISELNPDSLEAVGIISDASTEGRFIMGDFTSLDSMVRHNLVLDRTQPFGKDTGVHYGITGWAATSSPDFKKPERFAYFDFAHS